MGLRFTWDRRKASANLAKHRVSFEEATTVFGDPRSITISHPDHSDTEERFVAVGLSHEDRLLVVAHTEQEHEIRIIGAHA
jgi:uncharacterized protein